MARRVPASPAVPAGGAEGGGLCQAVSPWQGVHAHRCPLGAAVGSKGSRQLAEDGGVIGVRGCKGGAPHIASGLRRVFSERIMVCPPETPGPCWNQPHNISFPSQSDVLENNVFPRQRRVPDDGEGSQGLAGCRLMFCGHPGSPSPAPFWGVMAWFQASAVPVPICIPCPTRGQPDVLGTTALQTPSRVSPSLPEPARGSWHDPSCGWDTSLLGRPPRHHVSPSRGPQRG